MFANKMPRNTKRKLAIFAGTCKCLVYAEAKFCASDMPGEVKYYECHRSEYCCAFGCCVSPGLHFHHLWYYWLLVIIMFLVCSGGGWWYRYWLQGRYRAATSTIPSRSSTRAHSSVRGSSFQGQQARITYNSARNTVLLHRMWKGPQRNGVSPAHNGSAASSAHYQNMSVMLNDTNCPYYQLYGPPPSYETVIAQSRGKLSHPGSPEQIGTRMVMSPGGTSQNPSSAQCFVYPCSPSARINGNADGSLCQNESSGSRLLDGHCEDVPFAHYSQHCVGNAIVRQSLPYRYQDNTFERRDSVKGYVSCPTDKSSDTSDTETGTSQSCQLASDRYAMVGMNCDSWDHSARQNQILKVHGRTDLKNGRHPDKIKSHKLEDSCDARFQHCPSSSRMLGKCSDSGECSKQIINSPSSPRNSDITPLAISPQERTVEASTSPLQSNPSNNVILASFAFDETSPSTANVRNEQSCSNLESQHKLDRSRSLD